MIRLMRLKETTPLLILKKPLQISISDDDALDLYNMTLEEAVVKILELQNL